MVQGLARVQGFGKSQGFINDNLSPFI